MNRRKFLKVAGLSTAALMLPSLGGVRAQRNAKPNIIYILADDMGYGNPGCYGQETLQTPNIQRLAAEGMKFTDHYAGSTVCAPSRCALMTGMHMGHAYIRGNQRVPLRRQDVTVAGLLQDAGYVTGLYGKWGLGEPETTGIPNKQGFDEFFGYLNQHHAHDYYPVHLWDNMHRIWLSGNEVCQRQEYSHNVIHDRAMDFLSENKENPFFLYLAYTLPHANNERGSVTRDGMEVPDYGPFANENWPDQEKGFAMMVKMLDDSVGEILDLLQEYGIDENTVVFFSSDNGPHHEGGHDPDFFDDNGPLRGYKRDLYEGGIRVPMLARWPGTIEPGSETDHPSAFWDVLPTAAEIAGIPVPEGIDGISFLPALKGEQQQSHDYLYWEFSPQGGKQAVRMGDWKGVRLEASENPDAPIELYNLRTDKGETRNVADQHPDITAKIAGIMESAHTDSQEFPL
ncbi:MAG TPA: sulfatase-like hydrolase/transferase [bacterium]|nr:sulfatase-like hydrolase/transferase [bacterium]